ncbi:hypothetical protein [Streptomyces rimosus]|uniref:hypothetical protein n=1 Tax=Streptomyces rimosus TaxID=1927 RepID=UPI0004C5F0F9|nr:hypothetical protein [Streptomyces rimosus]
MTFGPPRYTWTATTAREASGVLQAATDLLDAHIGTLRLSVTDGESQYETERRTPVRLEVSFDLSTAAECINAARTEALPLPEWPRADALESEPKLGKHQARGLMWDLIHQFAEEGRRMIGPKDFTTYLPRLTRSRPWVVAELQRLVADGVIEAGRSGEYLLNGGVFAVHRPEAP